MSAVEAAALRASAASWIALTVACLTNSRPVVNDVFGLATATFEDNVREPAAGFLEITSALFPLEAALLLGLAATAATATTATSSKKTAYDAGKKDAAPAALILSRKDRARAGYALTGVSAGTLGALALVAGSSGMAVTDLTALATMVGLVSVSGLCGARALQAVEDPLALYKADAADLFQGSDEDGGDLGGLTSFFYRSSALASIVVGASFILSPVSPIALFEAESAATHLLRSGLGLYIVLLLAPIQAALYRAAKRGPSGLGEGPVPGLNVATGVACGLLVCDGRVQVDTGTAAFATLQPGTEFYDAVTAALGDPYAVGRASTNTTAAFSVGLLVSFFYLYQAFRQKRVAITD